MKHGEDMSVVLVPNQRQLIGYVSRPDMAPNQRQLFIVVSDWGSYLGSHFHMVIRGILSTDSCLCAPVASRFVCACLFCLAEFRFIKNMWNSTHAAP